MKFLKNTFLTQLFAEKFNNINTVSNGMVGISMTSHNISMAHICGSGLSDIMVNSYRCVPTNDRQQQIEALIEYVEEYQLIDFPCSYVLPIDKYVLGMIESPDVTENDKPEVVRLAVRDFVDYPIEEAVIDVFPLPFKRIDDNKEVSYAVIAHYKVIDDVAAIIKETGLRLKYIGIHELCLRNLAMLHAESNKGTLFLRLYANGGHVVLVNGNTVFMTRRIDLPLRELFLEEINVTNEQKQGNQQRTYELLEALTLDLQRSIDYCSGMFRQSPINCIMLSPSEFVLNNISDFLAKHLGMIVHTLDLPGIMRFSRGISQLEQARCLLAIGAGLREITAVDI